jgi:electron transfer flavoprotein-quinone oxidoreductase
MKYGYDVIVVGAGFGGPVAAKKCADAGLRTLMIERSENVGEKVISGLTIPIYGFLFGPAFIRDGNPPIERPVDGIINYIIKDVEKGDIEIDDSLMIPKPFSPIYAFGYNAYCQPFCEWEARKAVESGAELRTSTVVTDVIMEAGSVKGVITETGEKIRSRIVIDAEGSQGLVAVKAGIRRRYPPETISLADVYDYKMPKDLLDEIFGFSIRFCWGWDEQRCAPPLGYGNGLMVWPYRDSIHYVHDQCLRTNASSVPNLRKMLAEYHDNITSKLPWWKENVAPHAELRGHMWENFEIYVGLNQELRSMPNHTDGMILVGDVAGLESTELCDGVPQAWISADIGADVAIEALKANDTSRSFLSRYDERIKAHPILQWSISGKNRFNLRYAQKEHDLKKLKKLVHSGWGLGAITHLSTPLMRMLCRHIIVEPSILMKWSKMFCRYYFNWHHGRFDDSESLTHLGKGREGQEDDARLRTWFRPGQLFTTMVILLVWILAILIYPLTGMLNPSMKILLPVIEPIYTGLIRMSAPWAGRLSRRRVNRVANRDPSLFEV